MSNLLNHLRSLTPKQRNSLAVKLGVAPNTIYLAAASKSCGVKLARAIATHFGHPSRWPELVPPIAKKGKP